MFPHGPPSARGGLWMCGSAHLKLNKNRANHVGTFAVLHENWIEALTPLRLGLSGRLCK